MNQITLWLADIRQLEGREEEYLPLLTEKRRRDMEKHRVQEDRLRRAAAGLLLRRALNVRQDDDLSYNDHGRPELAGKGPKFNLSHNGSYAVLAVSDMELGVDVEPVIHRRPIIPRRFLQADELEWLGEEPSPERFAVLWTRLESAIKADGRGFDMEERDFSVVESGHPWYLHTFTHDGHIISCAAGEPFEVRVTVVSPEELLK